MEELFFSVVSEARQGQVPWDERRGVHAGHGEQSLRTRGRVHDGLGRRRESKMVAGLREEVEEEDDEDGSSGNARHERSAQHCRGQGHDHHCFRSSNISDTQGHALERAKERRTRDHVQGEERVHAIDELMTCGRNQSTVMGDQICQTKNKVVFDEEGSYIENKPSGRKVATREVNGVHVIDVHVKDLIVTGVSVFVELGEQW